MAQAQIPVGCGRLPSPACLAYPYVPVQMEAPEVYPAKAGLRRGTLFPGLELPFLNEINQGDGPDTPLAELQALQFAIQELGLYLDTHKDDREASELFSQYAELSRAGKARYQELYGPLCMADAMIGGEYNWMNGPWPWEIAANQEG